MCYLIISYFAFITFKHSLFIISIPQHDASIFLIKKRWQKILHLPFKFFSKYLKLYGVALIFSFRMLLIASKLNE